MLRIGLLLGTLMLPTLLHAQEGIPEKTLDRLKSSTVLVKVVAGSVHASGSGFLIEVQKNHAYVVTNAHVVRIAGRQADRTECVFRSGTPHEISVPASVVAADPKRDLAVLLVRAKNVPEPLNLSEKAKVRETLPVFIVGFPFGEALSTSHRHPAHTISKGSISSVRRNDHNEIAVIQVDGGINPGNSGGPIVDVNGALVGIAVAKVTGTEIGMAIPTQELKEMLLGRVATVEAVPVGSSKGSVDFRWHVQLVDPLGKIQTVSIETIARPRVATEAGSTTDEGWNAISPNMQRHILKIEGSTAKGEFPLAGNAKRPLVYLFQARYVRGDGKTLFTEPAELQVTLANAISEDHAQLPTGDLPEGRHGRFPAAEIDIHPPDLSALQFVEELPSPVKDVVAGRGGRYLILHLPDTTKFVVFDVNEAKVSGTLPAQEDTMAAAGLDKLILVSPFQNKIQSFQLGSLKKQSAGNIPVNGVVKAICLGNASNGPLLVHWALSSDALARAYYTLFDIDTFRPIRVGSLRQQFAGNQETVTRPSTGGELELWHTCYRDHMNIRASGSGNLFGLWCTSHSPSGLQILLLEGQSGLNVYHHTTAGHVVPNADGSGICTASGYYTPDLARKRNVETCLPSYHPDYYMTIPKIGQQSSRAVVHDSASGRSVLELPELEEMTGPRSAPRDKRGLTLDKRYHLIPQAGLLITIPTDNDRLVLRQIDLKITADAKTPSKQKPNRKPPK